MTLTSLEIKDKSFATKFRGYNVEEVDEFLYGAKVTNVRRRAKVLIIDFDSEYSLVAHLKMTGQMIFRGEKIFAGGHPTDSLIGELPDRSTRVQIDFTDDTRLFFNDQRKFGWLKLIPTVEIKNMPFMQKVGPEPLDKKTTAEEFISRIRRRNNSLIKPALLDQSTIAGVGNIYADESLFLSGILPNRPAAGLKEKEIRALCANIKKVLRTSIELGGSSRQDYVNAIGQKGDYLDQAYVYGRTGEPCRTCGRPIEKIKLAGRGTHFCRGCQK